jgi:hypothetical protein
MQIEDCKHYDGRVCKKCGRMMPDSCKDQEDLEAKAAAFDQLVADGTIEVVPVTEVTEETTPVPGPAPKAHHGGRPKKNA